MDRTVLVTGGAGYIGSHTVVELLQAGFDVIVLDNFLNSDPSVLARIESLAQEPLSLGLSLKHIEMDVRDEAGLIEVFKAHRIAGVIHFAGSKRSQSLFNSP